MKYKIIRQYFVMAFIIALVISILDNLPLINYQLTGNLVKTGPYTFSSLKILDYVIIYVLALISNFTAFLSSYFFIKPFNSKKEGFQGKVLLSVAVTFIVVYLIYTPIYSYVNHVQINFYIFNVVRSGVICFLASSYSLAVRSNQLQQLAELENEKLKKENLQTQIEALKNDLSPHFLFNSLNALQTLIRENPQAANLYVNHLSNVLRNSLKSNDSQYISLDEEIKLVQSYIFLMEMRYGSNLKINVDGSIDITKYKIPPLTLQTLIENAIKHNEISKKNPLTIKIIINKNNLIVENNIQSKISLEPSMGIGLANLSKRFLLLNKEDIDISKTDNIFRVSVPLIKA